MCVKSQYLNEKLTINIINGKPFIESKNDDQEIRTQLIWGGVRQVLTSNFGYENIEHSIIAREWIRTTKKYLNLTNMGL